MQSTTGGAQVYGAPDVDFDSARMGGAMAYALPPRRERNTAQGGAMVYDAPLAPLPAPMPRIRMADLDISPSPIARTVIEAAAYAHPQATEREPFETTIRMASGPPSQNRLGLREAEIARKRRMALVGIGLLALCTTLGALRRQHGPAVTPDAMAGLSTRSAYTALNSAAATGGKITLAAATSALPSPKPARKIRRRARHTPAVPVPTEARTAVNVVPTVTTSASRVTPRTVMPAAQSRVSLAATAAPITSRAAVAPPASPTPEILPDDTPDTSAVHTLATTPPPRRHHRRHHAAAPPAPREQTRAPESDIEAEFTKHPEPGYDEKADRWLDNLPDR